MKAELASPLTDPQRLAALRRTRLLDSPPEESFDRLARLAGRLLNTPIALVSLVDEHRQFFKSCIGVSEPLATLRELPISHSFCRHAVDSASPLILEDAREHPLFRDNPAIEELGVVAYAGIPLITPDGHALGSFCVLDTRPRRWTHEQIEVLRDLADSVMTEVRLREGVFAAREQEAAESDARHRFESLVQGLNAIVYDIDLQSLGFTFVSQRAEDLLGYPVRRWIEEPDFWQNVLLHPDDRDWALEFCQTATRDGRDHELEYRAIRADGEVLWLRELIRVVSDPAGRTRALRGVIIDISEQKRAVEELRKREAQLGEAQALAHLGSWEVDLASDTLTWSDELYRLCGLEPQSVPLNTQNFLEFIHPDDRPRVEAAIRQALQGEPYCEEVRLQGADGSLRYAQVRGEAVTDTQGRPILLRGTGQDITDRKLAEQARVRAEADARTMASRMRAVAGAAAGVIGADSLEALQQVLRDECRKVMAFDTFTMALYDEATHSFALLEGYDGDVWVAAETIPADGTPGERVIRSRRSLVTRHSDDPEAAGSIPMGTGRRSESIIRSPILSGERVLGLVSVQSYTPDLYTEQDVEVLEAIASLAATALLNQELLREREAAEAALLRANEELEQRVAERTAELQQRTSELEAIFQALPDLYFRLSPEGLVLDYRAADADRLLPTDRFVGRSLTEMLADLPEEAREGLRDAVQQVNRTGELVSVEYPLTIEGVDREFEARLLPLADGSLVAVVRDITDRKRMDEAIRRSEEHFRRLIENAHDIVFVVDPSNTLRYISPSVERILGYPPEELVGTRNVMELHPDDAVAGWNKLAETIASPGTTVPGEFRIRHKDGSWRVLETFARTLSPDTGDEGVVVNARDITERKEAEAELERQRAYFEQLLASVDAGVAAWDPQGRFEYVSPNAIQDPELRRWMIGKSYSEYGAHRNLEPEVVERRRRSIRKAVETRAITQFEESIEEPEGTRHMLRRNRPVLDQAGEVERVIGYSVDITERKRTEEAVRRATEEAERARVAAERANRAKSEFLSRMSHELRTPMNSILGFAQLLDRGNLPPEHKKGVGFILRAGRHLLHLINEVLEIARIEAGRQNFSLEPVRAADPMREAIGLVRPLAAQRMVELEEGPWPYGDLFVQADRQRLVQVLLNLLSNAIKYNRPIGGRVRMSCEPTPDGERLAIRVADTGRGIDPEETDQLFTPFARLGAERSDVEGTGLGLALSQRLTEAMGGTLALERTSPEGSVFLLELPRTTDPARRLERSHAPSAQPEEVPHGPARLLYIEDNLANLSLVETILESRPQWDILPALQGGIGVELAREHRPDLILLDLHLPDIPGEEVLRRLRAEPRTASIPVVVITADATHSTVTRLRDAGADAYLTKPLEVDDFLNTLGRFLAG